VFAEAFLDRHSTLSLTCRDARLRTEHGLQAYREAKVIMPSGTLPGLCELTHPDLVEGVTPALPPWHEPDALDPEYGHLHCNTKKPTDAQAEQMATLATGNRLLIAATKRR
jgi:hypothetical protein